MASILPFSGESSEAKTAVMNQVRQETSMNHARQLIEKINEHCFEKCIPTPGNSMSKREETCFTQCMTKYIETWNTVAKQYYQRAGQGVNRGTLAGGL